MKLTNFIAATLTVPTIIPSLVTSAQALSLRWGGYPDFFQYDLTLNSDATLLSSVGERAIFSEAIEELFIYDDAFPRNEIINKSNLDLKVINIGGCFDPAGFFYYDSCSEIQENFDTINAGKMIEIDESQPIFEYTVNISERLDFTRSDDTGFTETFDIDYQTFGFLIPSAFSVDGREITLTELDTSLRGLEALIGLEIDIPIVALVIVDEGFGTETIGLIDSPAGGLSFIGNDTSIPESSSTLSLLTLGILGIGTTLKRKQLR